jgi:hypothetical protein
VTIFSVEKTQAQARLQFEVVTEKDYHTRNVISKHPAQVLVFFYKKYNVTQQKNYCIDE